MSYQPAQGPDGKWYVVGSSGDVIGPFTHRGEVSDWILAAEKKRESDERADAARYRAKELSDEELVRALKQAIENPPKGSRGRPVPDNPRDADMAFEYYWLTSKDRKGERLNPARAVVAVVKAYSTAQKKITADYVRKIRAEYAPVGTYDDHLLTNLRADALQRRLKAPSPRHQPKRPKKLASAQEWLQELLKKGCGMPAAEVFQRGRFAGISHRTIERAASSLAIRKSTKGRGARWTLPAKKSAKNRI